MKTLTNAGIPQGTKYRKKPRQKADTIEPVILLTPAGCMKLAGQSETQFYGYNLVTEKLEGYLKTECANVTKLITPVLKDRYLRAQIAYVLSGGRSKEASQLLGISDRSLYRYFKEK